MGLAFRAVVSRRGVIQAKGFLTQMNADEALHLVRVIRDGLALQRVLSAFICVHLRQKP
jgi:hypothetical protein